MAKQTTTRKLSANERAILQLLADGLEEKSKQPKKKPPPKKKKPLWYNLLMVGLIIVALWWFIDAYNKIHGAG